MLNMFRFCVNFCVWPVRHLGWTIVQPKHVQQYTDNRVMGDQCTLMQKEWEG